MIEDFDDEKTVLLTIKDKINYQAEQAMLINKDHNTINFWICIAWLMMILGAIFGCMGVTN